MSRHLASPSFLRKPTTRRVAAGLWGSLSALVVFSLVLTDPAASQRRGGRTAKMPAVSTADVKLERINERVAAVGSGRARLQVTVTTRISGVVEKVYFEPGQRVSLGDPLVAFASRPEQIAVETAEAQRAQAAGVVARYKQLSDTSVSRAARAEAETALKIADAAVRRAREDLARMTVRAPFNGVIGLTNIQIGDYVAVGTPIAPLDDRSALLIDFTVPEAYSSAMKKGLPVRANPITRTGETYNGVVAAVGTRIDPVSRTLSVRAEIPNPNLTLIPGSTFSVSVRLTGTSAPVVPSLAVQWDRRGAYVWRVKDKKVERVSVAILSRESDRVLLDAKLGAGDVVVHEGGDLLREGQVVKVTTTLTASE
ncbi:MAG: efflux RND transporter periplasmic adaptor subunit [Hyphomicrobiaceae bacterium]